MLNFKPVTADCYELYNEYLHRSAKKSCEASFLNVLLWGEQFFCVQDGFLFLLSRFGELWLYSFPLGEGDKAAAIEKIIADSKQRKIPFLLHGMVDSEKEFLEENFKHRFKITSNPATYDYIYSIDSLCTLSGKKYHSKRNFINRFTEKHPDYRTEPLTQDSFKDILRIVDLWHKEKGLVDGEAEMEKAALVKMFNCVGKLPIEGLVLKVGQEAVAFAVGSRLDRLTFDVHFEKAIGNEDGSYALINREFARYIKAKYPETLYLDREEDLGLAGLKKAKESYHPLYLLREWQAQLLDLSFSHPEQADIPSLKMLMKETFGDGDSFIDSFFGSVFSLSHTFVARNNGEISSALYVMDCEFKGQKFAYIYGVATAEKFRRRGFCSALLDYTHKELLKNGYAAELLVPETAEVESFWKKQGFKTCTYKNTLFATSDFGKDIPLSRVEKEEFEACRRALLPENSVLQEGRSTDLLYDNYDVLAGESFLLVSTAENGTLYAAEYLGHANLLPDILYTLGIQNGEFHTVGEDEPFAMYLPLQSDVLPPSYFGLAFD